MKRFIMNVSFAAIALAAPLFSASPSLAATATCTTTRGTVVTINDTSTCHFETSTACSEKCTPQNFTTTCSAQCTASSSSTCTNSCETQCNTECTVKPATFTCKEYCSGNCQAGCEESCSDDGCSAQCSASCESQCTVKCQSHPGSTDCTTACQDSCSGSCTVEANVVCGTECTNTLSGGCTTKCDQPSGGLFCDGQYIDVGEVTDCNFEISVTATGNISTSCAASPGPTSPAGLPVGLVTLAGLGLLVARRRRNG